jgi:hypothetical protein
VDHVQTWHKWLASVPPDQKIALAEALGAGRNGESKHTPENKEVSIVRTNTSDLLIADHPTYVDVFGLHKVYESLAFETNIILKGPKGDGKTLSVFSYASKHTIPLVIQECSEETKKHELIGSQMLLGDETVYVLGSIPTAIEVANEAGSCILLFEEFNALTPQVQKQLNAIADFRKMVSLPHIGKTYRLRPGAKIWLVATMNPSVYGGTYDLNEDLKSRFEEIEVTYPEHAQEKQIVKVACADLVGCKFQTPMHSGSVLVDQIGDALFDLVIRLAKETRQNSTGYSLSTRDVVRLIRTMSRVGVDAALQMVIGKFEDGDKDTVMKRITSVFGPRSMKKFWGAV